MAEGSLGSPTGNVSISGASVMTMRRLPCLLVVSVAGLAVVPGLAALSGGNSVKKDSQASLVRPDPAPDPDASGTLRIRENKNSQRFDVHIEHADPGQQHDVFIE